MRLVGLFSENEYIKNRTYLTYMENTYVKITNVMKMRRKIGKPCCLRQTLFRSIITQRGGE